MFSCCLVTSMAEFAVTTHLHPQSSMQTCSPETAFSLPASDAGNTTDRVPPGWSAAWAQHRAQRAACPCRDAAAALAHNLTQPGQTCRRHRRPSWAPGRPLPPFSSLPQPALVLHLPQHTITRPFIPADFCVFLKFALCARHSARC